MEEYATKESKRIPPPNIKMSIGIPRIKNITINSPAVLMKKGLASLNAFFSRIFSPENFCLAIITEIEAKIKNNTNNTNPTIYDIKIVASELLVGLLIEFKLIE